MWGAQIRLWAPCPSSSVPISRGTGCRRGRGNVRSSDLQGSVHRYFALLPPKVLALGKKLVLNNDEHSRRTGKVYKISFWKLPRSQDLGQSTFLPPVKKCKRRRVLLIHARCQVTGSLWKPHTPPQEEAHTPRKGHGRCWNLPVSQ